MARTTKRGAYVIFHELGRAAEERFEETRAERWRQMRKAFYDGRVRELSEGRGPRQPYDLDLTATEVADEPKALPAPKSED